MVVAGVKVSLIGDKNKREINMEVTRALNETKAGKATGIGW